MPTATCNGVDLHYEVHGSGDPLVCVMGMGADSTSWALNVGAFAERHTTVVFDNRDVGRSGYVDHDYETSDMAQDALALADHLGLDTFHLLGVSLGGAISQQIALAAPERVRTLQLAVTWAGGGKWWRTRGRSLWRGLPLMTPEEVVEQSLMFNLSSEAFDDDALRERATRRVAGVQHPQRPEGFLRQAKAANRHEVRGRLHTLTMPVHVIGGEHDVLVPVFKAKEIAELVPGAVYTVVQRGPHGVITERAEEFNALVLDFIATAK